VERCGCSWAIRRFGTSRTVAASDLLADFCGAAHRRIAASKSTLERA
jgi:hypothetical protein